MSDAKRFLDPLSLFPGELSEFMESLNQPAWRGKQIFSWLHRGAKSFDEMTDLPKNLRERLNIDFSVEAPFEVERLQSRDGTQKILWELADGERVESALMQYETGTSLCVSTQAGCRQGCSFCASCASGLARNLTAGEILGQVLRCRTQINRLVIMGMGEPLDNFENTTRFLRLVSHPEGKKLSLRNISISTCGLVPEIDRLSLLGMPVTLSVSLHAPDDETRRKIMPIAKKYPIDALIASCKHYFQNTRRRISYEYVMLKGINDTDIHARKLNRLLAGQTGHINLIPYNPVYPRPYQPSDPDRIRIFARQLSCCDVTVRRTLGSDINAACGQLAAKRNL
ncbi:MAG: 23S rRNA (adenine(2503)-C(2))-methyltransferase RlmN [Oscillospiraceae bacterium]|nr:23S rRNA (adenine(2503)-C(2))-methyltransferase RlmN [Oscillospiraceae bacterium]